MTAPDEQHEKVARATRFPVQLPLQYRQQSTDDWLTGATADISASGAKFFTSELLGPGNRVELRVKLEGTGLAEAELVCLAEVVRQIHMNWPEVRPAVAVKFQEYQLHRAAEPSYDA